MRNQRPDYHCSKCGESRWIHIRTDKVDGSQYDYVQLFSCQCGGEVEVFTTNEPEYNKEDEPGFLD